MFAKISKMLGLTGMTALKNGARASRNKERIDMGFISSSFF
jgi:hypothetical protein